MSGVSERKSCQVRRLPDPEPFTWEPHSPPARVGVLLGEFPEDVDGPRCNSLWASGAAVFGNVLSVSAGSMVLWFRSVAGISVRLWAGLHDHR